MATVQRTKTYFILREILNQVKLSTLGNYSTDSDIVIEATDGYATDEGAEIIISTNYNHGVVVMFQSHDVMINSSGGINTIGAGNIIKIRNERRAVFVWSNDYRAYLFMSNLNNYDL